MASLGLGTDSGIGTINQNELGWDDQSIPQGLL